MSTSTIEPGTRLAGRYRLEDRASEVLGSTLWRAVDETLARSVSVRTFDADFPRTREVVTAARAASRLTDSRLTQVFDAENTADRSYVVSEWINGEHLSDLLAQGPLEPSRAAALVAETAEAVAAAHDARLTHLRLQPHCLVWTRDGTLKVLGFGVDAALYGISAEDPARADAQALGRLLYAALTGYWPGEDDVGLPAAPYSDGRLCSPRQLRDDTPPALDAITERALLQESRDDQPPLASPAQVVQALAGFPRPPVFPTLPPAPPSTSTQPGGRPTSTQRPVGSPAGPSGPPRVSQPPQPPQPPQPDHPGHPAGGGRPPIVGRVVTGAVVLLVLVVVALGSLQLGRMIGQPGNEPTPTAAPDSPGNRMAKQPLQPVSARDFDPRGDHAENPEDTKLAIDGDQNTAWSTQSYASPQLGKLKPGVGLMLDMGKPVRVSSVTVWLGQQPSSSVALRASNNPQESSFRTLDTADDVSGKVTLDAKGKGRARYVLLWFTKLPPKTTDDRFKGHVAEVVVRGAK